MPLENYLEINPLSDNENTEARVDKSSESLEVMTFAPNTGRNNPEQMESVNYNTQQITRPIR